MPIRVCWESPVGRARCRGDLPHPPHRAGRGCRTPIRGGLPQAHRARLRARSGRLGPRGGPGIPGWTPRRRHRVDDDHPARGTEHRRPRLDRPLWRTTIHRQRELGGRHGDVAPGGSRGLRWCRKRRRRTRRSTVRDTACMARGCIVSVTDCRGDLRFTTRQPRPNARCAVAQPATHRRRGCAWTLPLSPRTRRRSSLSRVGARR